MKQNVPMKRSRGHSSNGRSKHHASRSASSDGGNQNGNRIRGNAQQILDKYLALARESLMAGDRIAAEGFFQHAEHYYRMVHEYRKDDKSSLGAENNPAVADVCSNVVPEGGSQTEASNALDVVEIAEAASIPA